MNDSDDSFDSDDVETSFLLPGPSGSNGEEQHGKTRRRGRCCSCSWTRIVCYSLLVLLALVLVVFACFHVLLGEIVFGDLRRNGGGEIVKKGLVWELDGVKVAGVRDDGVDLLVDARVGVDVSKVFGWDDVDRERGGRGGALKRTMVRWGLGFARDVNIKTKSLAVWDDSMTARDGGLLASVDGLDRIRLPLRFDSDPQDRSWLRRTKLFVPVHLSESYESVEAFLRGAWDSKTVKIRVRADDVGVRLTGWTAPVAVLPQVTEQVTLAGK
jgi:hypothetical protein